MTDLGTKKYYGIGSRLLHFLQRFGGERVRFAYTEHPKTNYTEYPKTNHTHTHEGNAHSISIKLFFLLARPRNGRIYHRLIHWLIVIVALFGRRASI